MLLKGLLFVVSACAVLAQSPVQGQISTRTPGSVSYAPITAGQRFKWAVQATASPTNLLAGAVVSAWGTWSDEPEEYGPTWKGFAKRNGLRLSAAATGSAMEATIGSLWGEDPRYLRTSGQQPFKSRLGHVAKMTFLATGRDGNTMPAYARYIAVPGNSFLSNQWRPDSQTQLSDSMERIPLSFLTKFLGGAFSEFWPDLRQHVFKRK